MNIKADIYHLIVFHSVLQTQMKLLAVRKCNFQCLIFKCSFLCLSHLQVKKNLINVSYHIAQYTNIISDLRSEIQRLKKKIADQASRQLSSDRADIRHVQGKSLSALHPLAHEEYLLFIISCFLIFVFYTACS